MARGAGPDLGGFPTITSFGQQFGGVSFSAILGGGSVASPNPGLGSTNFAFLPPAVAPVIEEIVTTGRRTPPPSSFRVSAPSPSILARGNIILLIAAGLDLIARQMQEDRIDQMMREIADTDRLTARRLGADNPLQVVEFSDPPPPPPFPGTEVLPEIEVRARQPIVLPQPIRFDPDADPSRMVPIPPFVLPTQPAPAPVRPRPVTVPQPSTPLPEPSPRPAVQPQPRPSIRPGTRPLPGVSPLPLPLPLGRPVPAPRPGVAPRPSVQPRPASQPARVPRPSLSLRPSPTPLTSPQESSLPSPQPQPNPQLNAQCPKCPTKKCEEEEDKPRNQCFKKLVKEGLLPSDDEEFNWVEIDCFTGREL